MIMPAHPKINVYFIVYTIFSIRNSMTECNQKERMNRELNVTFKKLMTIYEDLFRLVLTIVNCKCIN